MYESFEPAQSVCLECSKASRYGGCCQKDEGYQLPISWSDAIRIYQHTGKAIPEFTEHSNISEVEETAFLKLSKVFNLLLSSKRKLVLKLRDNGKCVFLNDGEGCTLGVYKPKVCALFPFWPTQGGDLLPILGSNCLAWHRSDGDPKRTMELLGMDSAHMEKTKGDLYEDVFKHLQVENALVSPREEGDKS